MSEKIRVMFSVSGQTVGKPIEITDEQYIHFMIGQRDGDNSLMASFISGKFLKNKTVSPDEVSMTKAVGNPMWVYEIDKTIKNHEDVKLYEALDGKSFGEIDDDPEFDTNDFLSNTDPQKPAKPIKPNAIDKFIFKYFPKWEKMDHSTRQLCYGLIAVIVAICIIAPFVDTSKKNKGDYKEKLEHIKENASNIFE